MRCYLPVAAFAAAFILFFSSCRKNHVTTTPDHPCRLTTFKEFENVDPAQPNSGNVFKEWNLTYDQNKLIRIDVKKRGTADGYRTITYTGELPVAETFFDAGNNIQFGYKFNYETGTSRINSIDIDFRNVTPFVQARYVYHYDAQNRIDSIATFYRGLFTEYILYNYASSANEEKVTATLVQRSDSDPNFKLPYAIIEYVYDDKKSPNKWPVFMWNQVHDEFLNLVAPPSIHNIKRYTYKSLNSSESDPANNKFVYDITYPSFNAATFYNDNGYVTHYTENRLNSSTPVVHTYIYDCN